MVDLGKIAGEVDAGVEVDGPLHDLLAATDAGEVVKVEVPFATAPCKCVARHAPVVMVIELHHVFPQAEQIRTLGAVIDKRLVPLCSNAHDNIHVMLKALARSESIGQMGNAYQRQVARTGYERIKYAETNHKVMP